MQGARTDAVSLRSRHSVCVSGAKSMVSSYSAPPAIAKPVALSEGLSPKDW